MPLFDEPRPIATIAVTRAIRTSMAAITSGFHANVWVRDGGIGGCSLGVSGTSVICVIAAHRRA